MYFWLVSKMSKVNKCNWSDILDSLKIGTLLFSFVLETDAEF